MRDLSTKRREHTVEDDLNFKRDGSDTEANHCRWPTQNLCEAPAVVRFCIMSTYDMTQKFAALAAISTTLL